MSNLTDELTKLAELRERGILTDAEFGVQKAQLLQSQALPGSSAPPSAASQPAPAPAGYAASATPAAHPYNPMPAAPSAAPPMPASGHADEQAMRAFVGPNADYYLAKWRAMETDHKPNSWNWAAFLLSIYWLAYRKMFQPAAIAAGAVLLLVIVGMLVSAIGLLTNALVLAVAAGVGWRGNMLYRDHVRNSVARVESLNPEPQARLAAAKSQGGVSMPAALALLAVWVVVVGGISYFQIARAQRALATMNAPPTFSSSSGTAASEPGAGAAPATASGGYPQASAGAAYPSTTAAPAGGEWVVGLWGPVGSPPCSSWMRLAPDHSVSDNAGSHGTWSLAAGNGGADTLIINVAGQAPSSGLVARGAGNTMVMGSPPRTVTWQLEQC